VANKKKVSFVILAVFAFIAYTFLAAQPVPRETVVAGSWLRSLSEPVPEWSPESGALIPFTLGNRYGYVSDTGRLLLNREQERTVSIAPEFWAEYDSAPLSLSIQNTQTNSALALENPGGYPLFLDGRIFLVRRDQTSLGELSPSGEVLWKYEFEAPLTCIDAARGYVLTGTLDGVIDLLDSNGNQIFPSYTPGASRIPVILGCRLSSDGSKIAIVSGIGQQRFLFLELYGTNDYRVTHHQYLEGEGFRREVRMAFIGNDSRVVFEQEAGLGIYDVESRALVTRPLSGRLAGMVPLRLEALDEEGGDDILFYISSSPARGEKRFVVLKLPDRELANVPFKSEDAFLARRGNKLFTGGGTALAGFTLEKR
jgi:hypothetical protein